MTKKLLLLILVLAFALRFYKLGVVPPSLDWDENSNAYNAYSVLKTAKDEYGNKLPLYNRSFNDYKPPLYMYLSVPSVALFGLTPFAARLPSAFFGTLTILLIFFLARNLFENNKSRDRIALFSAFLIAISPWHIAFSRIGLEANIGLFTEALALTLFLYGIKKNYLMLISAIFVGLSFYTYHAERIFTPIIFAAVFLLFKKEIFKVNKKVLFSFFMISFLMILPLVLFVPKEALFQRFNESSSDFVKENTAKASQLILQDNQSGLSILSIIHNRRITLLTSYFENYLSNFDPNFLFIKGDENLRHHLDNFGMLNIFFLPLVLTGIYFSVNSYKRTSVFLLSWLFLAVLPASPVTPSPHAIRSFLMLIPIVIFAAIGLASFYRSKFFYNLPQIAFFAFLSFSFVHFIHDYIYQYPIYSAFDWQYGYSQAAKFTQQMDDKRFKKIFVDSKLEQAYIFWLFGLKYDPANYQKNGTPSHFDKYYFSSHPSKSGEVLVSYAPDFPSNYVPLTTINYPDGKEAIKIGYLK